jgi:FHS family L-fucose permease-like MFS transporter
MTCLETIANPYTTVLGAPEHGATRINIARTFNGVGWILGPIVGGHFVFAGQDGANANAGSSVPYFGIGIFAAVWVLVFVFARVPDLHAENESKKSPGQKIILKPSVGQLTGIGIALAIVWGLLYFFIAPILGLVWSLLNWSGNLLDPTKYGLIVVAYLGSFIVVSKNWEMFRRRHFTLGVMAQFLYVAAQTGIFSFCVNYIIENDPEVTPAKAATMLGAIGFVLFTAGRFCGSAVISQFKPHHVLATYAAINVVLATVCISGGRLGLYPKTPAPDIIDEHYYSTPEFFMRQATHYDKDDRNGPKIFVGEYAVTKNCGLGNLRGAIGEAAFMTGLERNSDVVQMASSVAGEPEPPCLES